MSKRVIAFSLVAVVVILSVWWLKCRSSSSDTKKPDENDPWAQKPGDGTGGGDSDEARALQRLRERLSGDSEEYAAVDSEGNTLLIPVEGTVLDIGTGETVGDVDIIFKARGRRGEATASSNSEGRYSLSLSPGIYRVVAIGSTLYGLASTLRLNNRLPKATHDVRMIGSATVRGKVVDEKGAGISGASVTFRSKFRGDKIASKHVSDYSPAASTATTASDGSYEVQVVPGEVLVEAQVGEASARTRLVGVAPGQEYEAIIVLDASASISGVVVSSDGAPVDGAEVQVVIRDRIKEISARTTKTDQDGRFRIDSMTPGLAEIEAHSAQHGTSPAVVEYIASAQSIDVRLVLEGETFLTGVVVDGTGRPINAATVSCQKASSKMPPVKTETDAEGAFRCAVSSGPHRVEASKADFGSMRSDVVEAPANDLRLQLAAPGGVRGIVRSKDGQPVKAFAIRVVQAQFAADGITRQISETGTPFADDDGSYDLPIGDPGTYYLVATAPGLSDSDPVVVEVPSGGYGEANFVLEPGGTISGVVRSDSGEPVEGASIKLLSGYTGPPAFSSADGRFTVSGVSSGARSIQVNHVDFVASTVSDIEVRSGKESSVTVELSPAGDGEAALVEYVGIGAVVAHDGGVRIGLLVKHSPGASAKLQKNDLIIEVDGIDTRTMSLARAVELLRGQPGTTVTLVIQRGDDTFTVTLQRRAVRSREYPQHLLARDSRGARLGGAA